MLFIVVFHRVIHNTIMALAPDKVRTDAIIMLLTLISAMLVAKVLTMRSRTTRLINQLEDELTRAICVLTSMSTDHSDLSSPPASVDIIDDLIEAFDNINRPANDDNASTIIVGLGDDVANIGDVIGMY